MEFKFEEIIPGPRDRVWVILRDRLPDLVPYLPNIDHVEMISREDLEEEILTSHLWLGNTKMIPAIARPFISKAARTWKDHGRWFEESCRLEWRFEPAKFQKLFTCSGVDFLEEVGDGTCRFRITGELKIFAERVPGVTEKMGKKISPKIERWILKRVGPNLREVPKAVTEFLAEEERQKAKSAEPEDGE